MIQWWETKYVCEKGLTPQEGEDMGKMQIVLILSNDFSAVQILKKLGHNDQLVVGIKIHTKKGLGMSINISS